MKHKVGVLDCIYWLFAVLPFIVSAALYSRMPEQVAVHWDLQGRANGYAGRATAAFELPLMLLGVTILVNVMLRVDPRHQNIDKSPQMKQVVRWSIVVIMNAAQAATIIQALGIRFNISILIMVLVGMMFLFIGNYLPKCKFNYTMGIRVPWTLASEENWRRTHRFAGGFWMLAGVLIIVAGIFQWIWAVFAAIVISSVVPIVYSFVIYLKEKKPD